MQNTTKKLMVVIAIAVGIFIGTLVACNNEAPAVEPHPQTAVANPVEIVKQPEPPKPGTMERFYSLWKDGKKDEANSELKTLLLNKPNDQQLTLVHADFTRYYTGSADESISVLRQAIKEVPSNILAHEALARYLTEGSQPESTSEAEQLAEQAINMMKQKGDVVPFYFYDTYGWTLGLNQKYDQSIETFINNVFHNSNYQQDDPLSMLHFALTLENSGHVEEAKTVYTDIGKLKIENLDDKGKNDLEWVQTDAKDGFKRVEGSK